MSRAKRGFVGRADLVYILTARQQEADRGLDDDAAVETGPVSPAPARDDARPSDIVRPDRSRAETSKPPSPQPALLEDLTGFRVEPQATLAKHDDDSSTTSQGRSRDLPVFQPHSEPDLLEVPLWQPRTYTWRSESSEPTYSRAPQSTAAALEADARERASMAAIPAPVPPPLSSHRRLLPMLEQRLTAERAGDELDVDALVTAWSRGEHQTELPMLSLRGWPPLVVLLDRDFELVPFWRDQERLLHQLRGLVGATGLVVRFVDQDGPEHGLLDEALEPVSPYDESLAGLPVLALTDLGWYRSPRHQAAWLRVGRRLRQANETIHALVPVPTGRWTAPLARTWDPMPWEEPAAGDGLTRTRHERSERASRLLDLAACAHRLEPGLLRVLRLLLPRHEANVGTEADAWLHRDMASPFPTATMVRTEKVDARRARALREPAVRAPELLEALRTWHWHGERSPGLLHSEVLALEHTKPGTVGHDQQRRAEHFVERLGARALDSMDRPGAGAERARLRRWLDYVGARTPRALWRSSSPSGRGLQLAWWATHDDDEPPPEADPLLRAEARREAQQGLRRLELRQLGRALTVDDGDGGGSLVAAIEASRPSIYVVDADGSRPVPLMDQGDFEAPPEAEIEIRTDRSTLRLEPLRHLAWAEAMGRDRYGLWAELEVGGVVHRMRWIAPGRFVMGSPDDEPGRYDWEGPRHEVTISRGFWLGETPVTQALWEAVMGDNPSGFRSPDRPVEQVRWDDCQPFMRALDERFPAADGEIFRLPTEAEWEHACRAGTSTATYAGPIEILGANNAPILDDIAWYPGNSGVDFDLDDGHDSSGWKEKQHEHQRAGTRRVALKEPNAWGLHDMLGNVWEWCEDGQRTYDSEPQRDPLGPMLAGVDRVYRGGSWAGGPGGVRAAFRLPSPPGNRYSSRGLRLLRGQGVRTDPEGPEGQA